MMHSLIGRKYGGKTLNTQEGTHTRAKIVVVLWKECWRVDKLLKEFAFPAVVFASNEKFFVWLLLFDVFSAKLNPIK